MTEKPHTHTHTHTHTQTLSHYVCQARAGVQSRDQTQLTLDVVSLAELQRLRVPPSDDSLKYRYHLQAGVYGKTRWVDGAASILLTAPPLPPSLPRVQRHDPCSVQRSRSGS